MSDVSIGTREYGQRGVRKERAYHCAVMDEVVYESETIIPVWPAKFAGLRVCLKHADPLSYAEQETLNPPRRSSTEDGP